MKPPSYIKKKGNIWKLKKPLYALNNTSRKFWLKVRKVFNESGLKILKGNEAFYYRHDQKGNLDGIMSSHVDDFVLAGKDKFMEKITLEIEENLEISKLENDEFHFMRIDVRRERVRIVVRMEEYARNLDKIEITNGLSEEVFNDMEIKVYR